MTDVNRINIKEFREFGYLQEVNRRFLHPLGLALEVITDDDTDEETLGGVWDYRDDPEGVLFGEDTMTREKYENVQRAWSQRYVARLRELGYFVQDPPPGYAKAQ